MSFFLSDFFFILEREDFFRLKKVKENKQKEIRKDAEQRQQWLLLQQEAAKTGDSAKKQIVQDAKPSSLLDQGSDSESDDHLFGP